MTKICIPISCSTFDQSLTELEKIQDAGADVVEWWLGEVDDLTTKQIQEFMSAARIPVLVNCKDAAEKGSFTGSDDEKLELLKAAAEAGAAYVDVDWQWGKIEELKEVIVGVGAEQARSSSPLLGGIEGGLLTSHKSPPPSLPPEVGGSSAPVPQLILSSHSWNGTPGLPALTRMTQKMIDHGADMVKFAAMPKFEKDVMTMMRLATRLHEKGVPHICISMGQLGQITRRESPFLHNKIMFATLPGGASTALGQYDVDELKAYYQ